MDEKLVHHLRDAYRGNLDARRLVLQQLRQLGHGCLSATLSPTFTPDVVQLDGWVLAQIAIATPLTEEAMDDIMPCSVPVACRAIARALEEHTGRPWHVRAPGKNAPFILVGPPRERLLPDWNWSEEDQRALAERFLMPLEAVKGPGLQIQATGPALCECLARAEGRPYVYEG